MQKKLEFANEAALNSGSGRFFLPVETKSEMNERGHWRVRHTRMTHHRDTAKTFFNRWVSVYALAHVSPLPVKLVRVSPSKLDDDNLRSALKGVRDGIADALHVDDGSDHVAWDYGQERGPFGVWVEVGRKVG